MRRFVAAHFPELRIELVRASMRDPRAPLALVFAREGGAVKDERSLLGNTRLDEVSREARKEGVAPRQTIASARAECSHLCVRVVHLEIVETALARIAEALLVFGATTSFDLETNTVLVDITGCAHLHRTVDDLDGEATLLARIRAFLRSMNHAVKLAIADGPLVASLLARYSRISIAPSGESKRALSPLPLHALPVDEEAREWMKQLGLKTFGDLQELPRAALSIRLGASAKMVLALLEGIDDSPLVAHVPAAVLEEKQELEYGIENTDALSFVMKVLTSRLAPRLQGRAVAATKLEVVLSLDRAFSKSPTSSFELVLSVPISDETELLALLRTKLEKLVIAAPILAVALRALETVPKDATQLHCFERDSLADRLVPILAAELAATFGPTRVGTLSLDDRWIPEERSKLVPLRLAKASPRPFSLPRPESPLGALLSGSLEPTRILPAKLPCSTLASIRPILRLESNEWWGKASSARTIGTAWLEPYSALAWVVVEDGHVSIHGWFD